MLTRIYISFICLLMFTGLTAQQEIFHWRAGAYGGLMNYHGDLSYKFLDPNPRLNDIWKNTGYFSYGFSIQKSFNPSWSLRLLWSQGEFIANDRTINWDGEFRTDNPDFGRSLNARTDINDFSILVNYHLDNDFWLGKNSFLAPYIVAGIGWSDFEVYSDLFTDTGQRYYYWSDNTIRDLPESNDKEGNIIKQDGLFETSLSGLQTEGKEYQTETFHLSAGLGLKFRISNRINLNLETIFRFTSTDYLDDVSGKFPESYDNELQAYASNPAGVDREYRGDSNGNDDIYAFTSLSVHYNFGRRRQAFRAPVIRTGFDHFEIAEVSDSTVSKEELLIDSFYLALQQVSSEIAVVLEESRRADSTSEQNINALTARTDTLQSKVQKLRLQQEAFEEDIRQELDTAFQQVDEQFRELKVIIGESGEEPATGPDSLAITFSEDTPQAEKQQADTIISESPDSLIKQDQDSLKKPAPDTIIGISSLQSRLDEIQKVLEEGAVLDTTGQTPPQSEEVKQLEEQLNQLEARLKDQDTIPLEQVEPSSELDQLQERIRELEERYLDQGTQPPVSEVAPATRGPSDENIGDLRNQLNELETTIRQLETDGDDQNRYDAQKEQIRQLQSQLDQQAGLSEEDIARRESYDQLRSAINALRIDLITTTGYVPATVATENDSLKKEIVQLNQRIDRLSENMTLLQRAVQGDTFEIVMPGPDVVKLSRRVDSLQQKLDAQQQNNLIRRQQETIDLLGNQIADLQRQLSPEESEKAPEINESGLLKQKIEGREKQAVFFASGSTALNMAARQTIDGVAELMATHQRLRVKITGFTDTSGNPQFNKTLAQKRARAVASYLQGKGVAQSRITIESFGEDPEAEPAYGRRVELNLVIAE